MGLALPWLPDIRLMDGDIMEYRGGKIGRRGMLAVAGSWAVWDSSKKLGAAEGAAPPTAPAQGVPSIAHYVAVDGGGSVQDYIDHLRSTTGGEMVGFSHAAKNEGNSVGRRLAQEIWVTDAPYNADPTGKTDAAAAIQAAIDFAYANGIGTVRLNGRFRTGSTLVIPSGISLEGQGACYRYDNGNIFEGTWIRYRGPAASPAIRYGSVQTCRLARLGIDCNAVAHTRAISIGSDNKPSTKGLVFNDLLIFGAGTAVQWGDSSKRAPLEQCDEISFRDSTFHSCVNGFVIDATNAADFSVIERIGFEQLEGVAFKLITPGFMRISQCAAGLVSDTSKMFEISGGGPDPVIIESCQSEGRGGKFLTYAATNDQGQIHLRGNVVNQPIEVTGITRVLSVGNYINSSIALSGYVRFNSECDVWDGALETAQVAVSNGARFRGFSQRDAGGQNGRWLPVGLKIDRDPAAGGYEYNLCVRAGIFGFTFVSAAEYDKGQYILPTADNGYAYKCIVGGKTSAQPAWPTVVGKTVASGTARFECVGAGALVKGTSPIEA